MENNSKFYGQLIWNPTKKQVNASGVEIAQGSGGLELQVVDSDEKKGAPIQIDAKDQLSGFRESYLRALRVASNVANDSLVSGCLFPTVVFAVLGGGFFGSLQYYVENRPTPEWDAAKPKLAAAMVELCKNGVKVSGKSDPATSSERVGVTARASRPYGQNSEREEGLWVFDPSCFKSGKVPSGALDLRDNDGKDDKRHWVNMGNETFLGIESAQWGIAKEDISLSKKEAKHVCPSWGLYTTVRNHAEYSGISVFLEADGLRAIVAYNDLDGYGKNEHVMDDLVVLDKASQGLDLYVSPYPLSDFIYGDRNLEQRVPLHDFIESKHCTEKSPKKSGKAKKK